MSEIGLVTGQRWKCEVCGGKQEPVDDEEWPQHCGKAMRLTSWYGFRPLIDKKEPAP